MASEVIDNIGVRLFVVDDLQKGIDAAISNATSNINNKVKAINTSIADVSSKFTTTFGRAIDSASTKTQTLAKSSKDLNTALGNQKRELAAINLALKTTGDNTVLLKNEQQILSKITATLAEKVKQSGGAYKTVNEELDKYSKRLATSKQALKDYEKTQKELSSQVIATNSKLTEQSGKANEVAKSLMTGLNKTLSDTTKSYLGITTAAKEASNALISFSGKANEVAASLKSGINNTLDKTTKLYLGIKDTVSSITKPTDNLGKTQETLGQKLKAVDAAILKYGNNVTLASQKVKILQDIQGRLSQSMLKGKGDADAMSAAFNKFDAQIQNTIKSTSGLNQQLSKGGGIINKAFLAQSGYIDSLKGIVAWQLKWFTGAGLVFGILNKITDAFSNFVNFEDSMRRTAVILNLNATEAKNLRDSVIDLSNKYATSSSDIAKAVLEIGRAIPNVAIATDILTESLKINTLAGGDLADAYDALITISNAWSGDAAPSVERASNVLTKAFNETKLGTEDFKAIFSSVANQASLLGISFEEVAAASGALADAGVKTGSIAAGLSLFLREAAQQSDKFKNALGLTTEQFRQLNPESNNLIDIFRRLNDFGITATQMFSAMQIRSARVGVSGAQLVDKMEQLEKSFNRVDTSGQQVNEILKSFKNEAKDASVEFDNLVIQILNGDQAFAAIAKTVGSFIHSLSQVVAVLQNMFGVLGTAIVTVFGLTTAFGSLKIALIKVQELAIKTSSGILLVEGAMAKTSKIAGRLAVAIGAVVTVFESFISLLQFDGLLSKEQALSLFALGFQMRVNDIKIALLELEQAAIDLPKNVSKIVSDITGLDTGAIKSFFDAIVSDVMQFVKVDLPFQFEQIGAMFKFFKENWKDFLASPTEAFNRMLTELGGMNVAYSESIRLFKEDLKAKRESTSATNAQVDALMAENQALLEAGNLLFDSNEKQIASTKSLEKLKKVRSDAAKEYQQQNNQVRDGLKAVIADAEDQIKKQIELFSTPISPEKFAEAQKTIEGLLVKLQATKEALIQREIALTDELKNKLISIEVRKDKEIEALAKSKNKTVASLTEEETASIEARYKKESDAVWASAKDTKASEKQKRDAKEETKKLEDKYYKEKEKAEKDLTKLTKEQLQERLNAEKRSGSERTKIIDELVKREDDAAKSVALGWKRGLAKITGDFKNNADLWAKFGEDSLVSIRDGFKTYFVDALNGNIGSASDLFKGFFEKIKQLYFETVATIAANKIVLLLTTDWDTSKGSLKGQGFVESLIGFDVPFLNFDSGGTVPGIYNGKKGFAADTVPAMLTPGEIVVPRDLAQIPEIGGNLMKLIKGGGLVQNFADGGMVQGPIGGPMAHTIPSNYGINDVANPDIPHMSPFAFFIPFIITALATAVITAVASAAATSIFGPEVGMIVSAIGALVNPLSAAAAGLSTVAQVGIGAVTGAISGGVSAAITGGDIGKSALTGGISGGLSALSIGTAGGGGAGLGGGSAGGFPTPTAVDYLKLGPTAAKGLESLSSTSPTTQSLLGAIEDQGALNTLKNAKDNTFDIIKESVSKPFDKAKQFLSGEGLNFDDDTLAKIRNAPQSLWEEIKNLPSAAYDFLSENITSPNKVKDFANNYIKENIGSIASNLTIKATGATSSIPQNVFSKLTGQNAEIPMAANGGIFTGPFIGGEAGMEAAIPMPKGFIPVSIDAEALSAKIASTLSSFFPNPNQRLQFASAVQGGSGNASKMDVNFAPVISLSFPNSMIVGKENMKEFISGPVQEELFRNLKNHEGDFIYELERLMNRRA